LGLSQRLALLAPEMAAHGGIQSYMWRLLEVLAMAACPQGAGLSVWSVNDSASALIAWGPVPPGSKVIGGQRRKPRFVWQVLCAGRHRHVVVGHVRQAPLAGVLRVLGLAAGYTVILHGIEAWERLPLLQRWACRMATRVVATTAHTAERFATLNDLDVSRLEVIPLCVDERVVEPDPQFRLQGHFRVLNVGRQWGSQRYKGFDELIAAVPLLLARGVDVAMHFVGQGDDQPRLRAKATALGVGNRVHFHSALPDAQLAAAYAQCDVFAMPSGAEGFGIAYLEAMRHAKPCIGAREGGVPEVIREGATGLLVPYGDVPALAEALAALASDEERRQALGLAGLQDVQGHYSAARFCERHLAALRPLLES
jgi:phosphatidyl-myo-inositol dimannoside synthase